MLRLAQRCAMEAVRAPAGARTLRLPRSAVQVGNRAQTHTNRARFGAFPMDPSGCTRFWEDYLRSRTWRDLRCVATLRFTRWSALSTVFGVQERRSATSS